VLEPIDMEEELRQQDKMMKHGSRTLDDKTMTQ
jgi:hypothetical protein